MTFTVPRHDQVRFPGWGLLKGLWVTGVHFLRTYFLRNRRIPGRELFPGGRYGLFTVQYPEEQAPIPDRYRGLPILLYDDATRAELCTACMSCARACPVGIIHIEQGTDAEGKKIPYAAGFAIEYDVCLNCGLCMDACAFGAIVLDHNLKTARTRREDFRMTKEKLLRPISYYEKIAPSVWAEMRDEALKRLAGTINRRPPDVGRVPRKAAEG
ncbi:MAG: 4Fe-4S dicluster domain-containing protein [Chloroflexia bacterium]